MQQKSYLQHVVLLTPCGMILHLYSISMSPLAHLEVQHIREQRQLQPLTHSTSDLRAYTLSPIPSTYRVLPCPLKLEKFTLVELKDFWPIESHTKFEISSTLINGRGILPVQVTILHFHSIFEDYQG